MWPAELRAATAVVVFGGYIGIRRLMALGMSSSPADRVSAGLRGARPVRARLRSSELTMAAFMDVVTLLEASWLHISRLLFRRRWPAWSLLMCKWLKGGFVWQTRVKTLGFGLWPEPVMATSWTFLKASLR